MKKKFRFAFSLLIAVALLASLSVSAMAEETMAENVSLSGKQDKTVFLAGQNVGSDAQIKGIAMAAGYTVDLGGESEYAMAAGYNTNLRGSVKRDAFAAGYGVAVTGDIERDAFFAGNTVTVSGEIGRDLYASGASVVILGRVEGDAYIDAETITVAPSAEIGGTLRYNRSAELSVADASEIGATEAYGSAQSAGTQEQSPRSTGSSLWGKLCRYLGAVAVAFALLWLTPLWERMDERYTGAPFGSFASAFGIGFGVLAGLPLAAILLMVLGFGVRLAFVLLAVYTAAILAAPVFIGFFLGSLIWRGLFKKAPCYWAELPIGLLVWWIAGMIPVVNFVVGLVTVPLGLGVLTLLLGKGKKAKPVEPDCAPEPTALPEPAQEQSEE